ncbi:hypothetical protein CQA53_07725 [Helicobacter didelphidarum]|uniref:Uncharacterized protein n=1 Tax=Helicobacter didelphidarum TaxID=2040648 RepID=A0A3D8IHH9_9HELI|nr:hypothetical protein [Helicobacter didelphidarum]RDU64632.1 hypothetical protein CQA53_07725 [Helicobacter didelphidarum]
MILSQKLKTIVVECSHLFGLKEIMGHLYTFRDLFCIFVRFIKVIHCKSFLESKKDSGILAKNSKDLIMKALRRFGQGYRL